MSAEEALHPAGLVWATYDHAGARLEYQPADPLDPVFFLWRARTRVAHAWRLFRARAEAARYAAEILKGDEDAGRWAESIPSADFDDLVRRFGVGPSS
jgi:hypothetical protein